MTGAVCAAGASLGKIGRAQRLFQLRAANIDLHDKRGQRIIRALIHRAQHGNERFVRVGRGNLRPVGHEQEFPTQLHQGIPPGGASRHGHAVNRAAVVGIDEPVVDIDVNAVDVLLTLHPVQNLAQRGQVGELLHAGIARVFRVQHAVERAVEDELVAGFRQGVQAEAEIIARLPEGLCHCKIVIRPQRFARFYRRVSSKEKNRHQHEREMRQHHLFAERQAVYQSANLPGHFTALPSHGIPAGSCPSGA